MLLELCFPDYVSGMCLCFWMGLVFPDRTGIAFPDGHSKRLKFGESRLSTLTLAHGRQGST